MMKKLSPSARALMAGCAFAMLAPLAAQAQNIAIVNGKAVPKARADTLMSQAVKQGQAQTPELETQVRDEVVLREIFMQEAEKRGLAASSDYKQQMELARQTILIRELFADQQKKHPITDAEIQAEYDKFKGQSGGTEYKARHILVEDEAAAKAAIAKIKGGAKFEDLAKASSKDPGSAPNGGDLDWAAPGNYVPEFSQAMVKLEKGKFTDEPVKSQFGYHIIQLDDVREAQFPPLEDIKAQLRQRLEQQKMTKYQEDLKAKAKTDYKFGQ
jgi:peptidyl-prolyl cis-trans isomerase C